MIHAVIMAGGIGSRFWPMSRRENPKQFLAVTGADTLIQNTLSRLSGIVPHENCYVVTNERYVKQTQDQLPSIPMENILAEPIARNTAPCIAYAAFKIHQKDPDAIIVVLPADHVIGNVRKFHETLKVSIEAAKEERALVTIGIEPDHPATGYGYIQFDPEDSSKEDGLKALFVKTFAEKPNIQTAERFLDSGDFLWNSGMFIWRSDSILEALETHLPDVHSAFLPLENVEPSADATALVTAAYKACPSISIDYGVMEQAAKVYVVPGSFDWNDVGDWKAVYDLADKGKAGNAIEGNAIVHDASRCLIQAGDKLVAVVGVNDLIVVNTDDALLVCHRDSSQRVKNVVDYLYANQLDQYV
ncbi:MAG: mannose-1-phosphate guanylyltransferase [Rhodothermales bacterium]|nr:mannose-1-phosphate guanylyltransferase [Rhodothermales bacterium]MDG2017399.1 mannose-1-phosphate guanylyltransferase [Rhodothermales bacterium]